MSNDTCGEHGGITWDLTGPDGDMGEYCPSCREAELAKAYAKAKREALEEAAKSLSVFQKAYTSAMMESYHQLRRDGHDDTVLESSADWILEIGSQCVRFLEALAQLPEPEKPCEMCSSRGFVVLKDGLYPCPDCQGKEPRVRFFDITTGEGNGIGVKA